MQLPKCQQLTDRLPVMVFLSFDDSRVKYFPIRFTEKGAMAKVMVKKDYTDGRYLTRLFFMESYPVKEQVFEFKVPEWLSVDFKPIEFRRI